MSEILQARGKRYSAIPILSQEGIYDVCLFEGTVNDNKFEDFVQNYLIPILLPFNGSNPLSVVIMDSASVSNNGQRLWQLQ